MATVAEAGNVVFAAIEAILWRIGNPSALTMFPHRLPYGVDPAGDPLYTALQNKVDTGTTLEAGANQIRLEMAGNALELRHLILASGSRAARTCFA